MKRLVLLSAAIFSLALLTIDDASAQRRGGGGAGVRIGGGGFGGAGARVGGGFRGGSIGRSAVGVRTAGAGYRGYRGAPGYAVRTAGYRGGYAVRGGIYRPGSAVRQARWYGNRWNGYRRWGVPIAVGVGLGYGYYAGYPYDNGCVVWDGYSWVNTCYGGYYAGYGY